jgi:TrpR-related protein YerC/YecD
MPTKRIHQDRLRDLCQTLYQLRSAGDLEAFLYDVCTPQELAELADRWHVAKILATDKKSYREIAHDAQVSVTTVGRVARFLHEEKYGGYRKALKIKAYSTSS